MLEIRNEVAIVLLACRDYESLEICLAAHAKFNSENVNIYILQNGKGSYDSEQTRLVARRFSRLYPETIKVIDNIEPDAPYSTIKRFLESNECERYKYIFKVDDDCFPIVSGWLKDLYSNYINIKSKISNLAYVTPLINNNCWGFKEIIHELNLSEEYFSNIARNHRVGHGSTGVNPYRILSKDEIETGMNGTIWGYPYIARWLHENTTLKPEFYIKGVKDLKIKEIDSSKRYSIGGIFFEKEMWSRIENHGVDDEDMLHNYCDTNDMKIFSCRWLPFVHLSYYSQKDENRDLILKIKEVYEDFLGLNYPISYHSSKVFDIENRLRYLESKIKNIYDSFSSDYSEDINKELHRRSLISTANYVEKNMLKLDYVLNKWAVHDISIDNISLEKGFVLEFGVFSGETINYIARRNKSKVYGFDSFEGLPEVWRSDFKKGMFSMSELPSVSENVNLIKGWFSDSIPLFIESNKSELDSNGISYLHIDCDLYSSTKCIFELLGPYIKVGTVIVFDEYFNYPGWEQHEYKAFQEFIMNSGLKYRYLTYNALHQQVALVIF